VSSREAATLAKLEEYPASSTLAKVEAHATYLTSSVLLFTIAVLMVSFAVTYVKGFVFGIFWSRSPLPTSRVSSLGFIRQGSSLRLRQGFRPWDNVKGFVPKITSSSQR